MASAVQTGKGVLFGIPNSGSALGIDGVATFTLDSVKVNRKFEMEALKDEGGFDCNLTGYNTYDELDITWTPTGASTAAAAATVDTPKDPLATMVLANFKVAGINGTWLVMDGQGLDLSAGKFAKSQLKLRKYADAEQNALLTTAVSG